MTASTATAKYAEALAHDIALVLATVDKLATDQHGPMGPHVIGGHQQRWITLHDLRQAVDLPRYRVDTALRSLAAEYRVWLRWANRDTTLDEDNAAVRISGQDFHDITADPWR